MGRYLPTGSEELGELVGHGVTDRRLRAPIATPANSAVTRPGTGTTSGSESGDDDRNYSHILEHLAERVRA